MFLDMVANDNQNEPFRRSREDNSDFRYIFSDIPHHGTLYSAIYTKT